MKTPRELWRATRRFVAFGSGLLEMAVDYAWVDQPRTIRERATWLQGWCGVLLRRLELEVQVTERLPSELPAGLLVANHLGYLDILILGAQVPLAFVSKAEVRRWPLLGGLAAKAGSIFVDRSRRTELTYVLEAMNPILEAGVPIVFFPEGTTSDGASVGPFHPGLFEVAAGRWPVFPAAISYTLPTGSAATEMCYWGSMTFLPHLLNLLTHPRLIARVKLSSARIAGPDRKALARAALASVREIKAELETFDAPYGTAAIGNSGHSSSSHAAVPVLGI